MKIEVKRTDFLEMCTIGHLLIDGVDTGIFTLEDKVRSEKVFGETAIPKGTYRVVVDYSNHFQKELPHLLNVPNFEGVRIHAGNTDKDTEGCILVGKEWHGGDFIGKSKDAFDWLFEQIRFGENVEITIS